MDPGFRDVPSQGFSVRWEGRIAARFSENYTFHLSASDGARLYLKPPGGVWSIAADSWATGGTVTFSTPLVAGAGYEIRLEVKKTSLGGGVALRWESPSTPLEVIECASQAAINHTALEQTFTDALRSARPTWESVDGQAVTTDTDGWPTSSRAGIIVSEYFDPFEPSPLELGRNAFRFNGRADVTAVGNFEIVPGSVSYDSATNTTSGLLLVSKRNWNIQRLDFRNATRNGQPGGPPGFTNLRIMRPVSPNATTTFAFDSLFHPGLLDFYSRFTAIRFQRVNDQTRTWAERMRPSHFRSQGKLLPFVYQARYGGEPLFGHTGMAHELEIMLCNAVGKDYYVTVPHLATVGDAASYVRKLALLIKHGSDGNEPYPAPVANPIYPPLNPNLDVIIEVGNELWNFAHLPTYSPFFDYLELMKDKANANDSDFQILNFDGLSLSQSGGNYVNAYTWARRWWALYLKRISDDFRLVFGNSALPGEGIRQPRIRPFFTWQYANTNETAIIGLDFMDRVFNNSDGVIRTSDPRPPAHFFYSGGGAGYYSVENRDGIVQTVPPQGFESPAITGMQTRPSGVPNATFEGEAGLLRPGTGNAGPGSMLNPPPVMEGSQCAWVRSLNGSLARVRLNFTVPAQQSSDRYALVYRWVQRTKSGSSTPDQTRLRVRVNGIDLTPPADFNQPQAWSPDVLWRRVAFWTGDYYWSKTFTANAGSTVEVVFETNNVSGDHAAFIDEVRLTSIDAFYSGGLGSGAATGQGALSYTSYQYGDGRWAAAYGLRQDTYEHGYSAGGDAGNSPLQDYAKFSAPQASASVVEALNIFHASGGRMPTFGTYSTIPLGEYVDGVLVEGVLNPSGWPLMQGISDVLSRLPREADNGVPKPVSFTPSFSNITLGHGNQNNRLPAAGSWMSFNLIAPHSGDYSIQISRNGVGTLRAFVDGFQAGSTTGNSLTLPSRYFTKGLHSLRLLNSGGDFSITQVTVQQPGAPPRPEFLSASASGTSVNLRWSQPPGATNYRLRWGITPEAKDSQATTPDNVISLSGFPPSAVRYFVVSAIQGSSESLPSDPLGLIFVPDNTVAKLALWEMAESNGNATNVPVAAFTPRLQATPLVRGPGYANDGNPIFAPGRFTFTPVGNFYANSASASATTGQFAQFQITVPVGLTASLSKVSFRPFLQANGSAWRMALSFATDGTNFSWVGTDFQPASGSLYHVDTSGVVGLQNISGVTVTFRIHIYGGSPYSTAGLGGNEGSPDVFVEGQIKPTGIPPQFSGSLASWEFQGGVGNEPSVAPNATAPGLSATPLERGPGLGSIPDWAIQFLLANRFGLFPASNVWQPLAEDALGAGHYAQFTISPQSGRSLSISSIRFAPFFQHHNGLFTDPRKCRVYYRLGALPAVALPAPAEYGNNSIHQISVSGVAALQNLQQPVTLLFVFHGSSPYEVNGFGQAGQPDIEILGSLQSPPSNALVAFRREFELNPNGSDDNLAPAGDGVSNIMKFAFNMIGNDLAQRPTLHAPNTSILAVGGRAGLPNYHRDGSGRLVLTYVRRKATSNPGITYTAEFSETLAPSSWQAAGTDRETVVSIDETWERVSVSAPTTPPKMFGRVRISVVSP